MVENELQTVTKNMQLIFGQFLALKMILIHDFFDGIIVNLSKKVSNVLPVLSVLSKICKIFQEFRI